MRFLKATSLILLLAVGALSSCTKGKTTSSTSHISGDALTATGTLQRQGITTYQYASYILVVSSSEEYVLESTAVAIDSFVGRHVMITATNTHYPVEDGPVMYNVTAIAAD